MSRYTDTVKNFTATLRDVPQYRRPQKALEMIWLALDIEKTPAKKVARIYAIREAYHRTAGNRREMN